MGYISIKTEIMTKLQALTEINNLFDEEPKELGAYPAVAVTFMGHQDTPHDTAGNVRVFQFMVRGYYPTDVANDAEAILGDLADKIIAALEADVTLNGSCDYTRATEGKFLYQEREIPLRIVEITISAVKRLNR